MQITKASNPNARAISLSLMVCYLFGCGGSSGFAEAPTRQGGTPSGMAEDTESSMMTAGPIDNASDDVSPDDASSLSPTLPLTQVTPTFTPHSGARFPRTGVVVIEAIDSAQTLCLSVNGVAPELVEGMCLGDGVQQFDEPPETLRISFACDGGETARDETRTLMLAASDPSGNITVSQATYTLTCALPAPPPSNDALTGAVITRQPEYTTTTDITLVYAISFNQQNPLEGLHIGIFPMGELNTPCNTDMLALTTQPVALTSGELIFPSLPAGLYQAQILDQKLCHIGAPAEFTVVAPQTTVYRLQDGVSDYDGTQDTSIARIGPLHDTPQGEESEIETDGVDIEDGETAILLQWALPEGISGVVSTVNVNLEIRDASAGTYGIYAMNAPWDESTAVWDSVNLTANQGQLLLGELNANETGPHTVSLNAAGIALVQAWIDGLIPNYGFIIRAIDTDDGIKIRTSEYRRADKRPELIVTTTQN